MTLYEWLGSDNEVGISIGEKKYIHPDETFDEFIDRVSANDSTLKDYILRQIILLGGRTFANRGIGNDASFFNCYSHGFVKDDYKDIMQTAMNIGLTFKAQGGQGISLSKLRPAGAPIGNEYTSDGIIPFMKIFNEVTAGTSQGGARKGALMISIDARHKEAEAFIKIKSQEGLIEKANLSLEIDDEFMEAVQEYYENGNVVTLHEIRNYDGHIVEYDVVPIEIFKMLVDNCYDWADPAALFVNRFRNYNIMQFDDDYQIETSNPCGEQPLPKHGACCLASINVSNLVKEPYTENAWFDFDEFEGAVSCGIETLDKLIDENYMRHPLKEQQEMSWNYRNVGLGVMGYATMLMKLGMRYGSADAIRFTDELFRYMFRSAVIESNRLARAKGPFPKYKDVVWDSEIMRNHFTDGEIEIFRMDGLRNCSLLSIAPTGSIATLIGESGGCEPEFAMKFKRRTVGMTDGEDTYYDVYCKAAKEYRALYNTEELPDYFVEAQQIPWQDRILTQAAMQNHVDTAISSTVNLPESTTKEDIAQLYLLAWELGLKGVTIFRNGCKRFPILSTTSEKDDSNTSDEEVTVVDYLPRGYIIDASDSLVGKKRKLTTGCGSLHVAAFFDPVSGDLMETYLSKGSTGGCANSLTGISRLISLSARAGCGVDTIADQLESCGACPSYASRSATKHDTSRGSSCPVAVGKALLEMWTEMQDELFSNEIDEIPNEPVQPRPIKVDRPIAKNHISCPECGEPLVHENGCINCKSCGWSKC